jgi:hypothetical protein
VHPTGNDDEPKHEHEHVPTKCPSTTPNVSYVQCTTTATKGNAHDG